MSSGKRLDFDYVKNFIENENYTLISTEYKNAATKMKMVCDKGHECEICFDKFRRGRRCKTCDNIRKTNQQVKMTLEDVEEQLLKWNLKLLDTNFNGINKKMNVMCLKCNHSFNLTFATINKSVHKCQFCHKIKMLEETKEFLHSIGYELISEEYVTNKHKLIVRCNHNHIFEASRDSIMHGNECPYCKSVSKGERKISVFLDTHNINYIQQKTFSELKFKRLLRFDFFLPEHNVAIEFDGIQHFEPVKIFGGEEYFEYIKTTDEIKNNFCLKNDIKIIRIAYFDYDDIEEILQSLIR